MSPGRSAAPPGPTVEFKVRFRRGMKGSRRLRPGRGRVAELGEPGRVPRISRLLALAIHFEGLVHRDEVRNHADLARLGGVTPARISQIMDLLNLAPAIQEEILFLPRTAGGRDRHNRAAAPTDRDRPGLAGAAGLMAELEGWAQGLRRICGLVGRVALI